VAVIDVCRRGAGVPPWPKEGSCPPVPVRTERRDEE